MLEIVTVSAQLIVTNIHPTKIKLGMSGTTLVPSPRQPTAVCDENSSNPQAPIGQRVLKTVPNTWLRSKLINLLLLLSLTLFYPNFALALRLDALDRYLGTHKNVHLRAFGHHLFWLIYSGQEIKIGNAILRFESFVERLKSE